MTTIAFSFNTCGWHHYVPESHSFQGPSLGGTVLRDVTFQSYRVPGTGCLKGLHTIAVGEQSLEWPIFKRRFSLVPGEHGPSAGGKPLLTSPWLFIEGRFGFVPG